jgi:hypothetical protein
MYKPKENIVIGLIGYSMNNSSIEKTRTIGSTFMNRNIVGAHHDFKIINTNNYPFDVDTDKGKEILQFFLQGMEDSCKLSKEMDYDCYHDSSNRVNHVVLRFNIKNFYDLKRAEVEQEKIEEEVKRSYWDYISGYLPFSSSSNSSEVKEENKAKSCTYKMNDVNLNKLYQLYDFILDTIAENKSFSKMEAVPYVNVLFTHMEGIPSDIRSEITQYVENFMRQNTPICFVSKECQYSIEDCLSHEVDDGDRIPFPIMDDIQLLVHNKNGCNNIDCPHRFDIKSTYHVTDLFRRIFSSKLNH